MNLSQQQHYKQKYLKYKNKYLEAKRLQGGTVEGLDLVTNYVKPRYFYLNSGKASFYEPIENPVFMINRFKCNTDPKKKQDYAEEYPLSKDGVLYLDNKNMYISIHLSNTEATLNYQLKNLQNLVNAHPAHTIYLMGDLNVVPSTCGPNKLIFYKKNEKLKSLDDIKEQKKIGNTCDFTNHTILFEEMPFDTTCKMRILTAQIDKIFEVASDKIDTIMVLLPKVQKKASNLLGMSNTNTNTNNSITHSLHYLSNKDNIKENTITENTFFPLDWCSDHALVKSVINLGDKKITVISLNASGESISGEVATNWAEFANKDIYDFIKNNKGLKELQEQMFADPKLLGGPIIIKDKENKDKEINTLNDMRTDDYKKYFSDDYTKGGLRQCDEVSNHRDPEILKKYENLSKECIIDGSTEKFEKLQTIFTNIMNYEFINKNNEKVNLLQPFVKWYNDQKTVKKITILEVLKFYLSNDDVDVIGLQEVNKKVMLVNIKQYIENEKKNYSIIVPDINESTVGILIIKKSLLEQQNSLPSNEKIPSTNNFLNSSKEHATAFYERSKKQVKSLSPNTKALYERSKEQVKSLSPKAKAFYERSKKGLSNLYTRNGQNNR